MTRLADLHKRLAQLQRQRLFVRWETAYSALLLAVLWILGAMFLIDCFVIHVVLGSLVPGSTTSVIQRLLLLAVAVAVGIWAFRRFTLPWLGQKENELDMALLVEREEHIDSDLVAAVQFESSEAPEWGSIQLEQAVIETVATKGRQINVMRGLSREELSRRSKLLLVTVIAWVLIAVFLFGHVAVFFNRLLLGSLHYPTRTRIESIAISGHELENPIHPGSTPLMLRYGEPLLFEIRCSGNFPETGEARLVASRSGLRPTLALKPIWSGTAKVEAGADVLAVADPKAATDFSKLDPKEVMKVTVFGGENAGVYKLVEVIDNHQLRVQPEFKSDDETSYLIHLKRLQSGTGGVEEEIRPYTAQLPRLVDSVQYRIVLGDAWTEPGHLGVGQLPNVELQLVVEPPGYVKADPKGEPFTVPRGLRAISVIEGSQVQVNIYSDKPLKEASVAIEEKGPDGKIAERQYALQCVDSKASPQQWFLDPKDTPLAAVTEPVGYSLQVTDTDGLQLEQPIKGTIRIQADSPPRIAAAIVTNLVLPTAKPTIYVQAVDDYGLAKLSMDCTVIRADGETVDSQLDMRELASEKPETNIEITYPFNLSPLDLKKGDQVEIEIRAVDFRGPRPGEEASADVLVFQVTDEAGILEHLTKADRQSARQLKTMIQRQLGIGESP